jgi:hypothetical protein
LAIGAVNPFRRAAIDSGRLQPQVLPMIHPTRDSLIALILTLSGLAAFAWGLIRLMRLGENDVPGGIAVAVGGLGALFGAFLLFNFRWAFRIARRMRRGEGIIARWTVPAETVTAYVAAEKARPWHERSRWKPKPGAPAEIMFSADGLLAGGRYHGLSSQGLNTFTAVDLVYGTPVMIQFSTREVAVVGDRLTSHRASVRVPVARGADEPAAKVMAHFRQVLSGAVEVRPDFWRRRRKIGLVIMTLSALAAGIGWFLAEFDGWRADTSAGLIAMVLMIVGAIFGLAGLALTGIAAGMGRR